MAKNPTKSYRPSEHNLTAFPGYVEAIGMISLETVDLELRLANLFARMVSVPLRVGQAIFLAPKAEQTRIDIFRNAANALLATAPKDNPNHALVKQKREALKKVEDILQRSEKLIRKRHRVIHDDWNVSSKEKVVTRRQVDGAMSRRTRTPIPKAELDDHINSLRHLIDDIYDLSEAFRAHPPFMANLKSMRSPD